MSRRRGQRGWRLGDTEAYCLCRCFHNAFVTTMMHEFTSSLLAMTTRGVLLMRRREAAAAVKQTNCPAEATFPTNEGRSGALIRLESIHETICECAVCLFDSKPFGCLAFRRSTKVERSAPNVSETECLSNLQALDSLQLRHTLYEVFRPQ